VAKNRARLLYETVLTKNGDCIIMDAKDMLLATSINLQAQSFILKRCFGMLAPSVNMFWQKNRHIIDDVTGNL